MKTDIAKCSCFSVHPVTWVIAYGEQADPNYFRPDPGCPVHGCGMVQEEKPCTL